MKHAQQTFVAFIPICGRMGSYKNPEIIIAVLSLIFTILIISSFVSELKESNLLIDQRKNFRYPC